MPMPMPMQIYTQTHQSVWDIGDVRLYSKAYLKLELIVCMWLYIYSIHFDRNHLTGSTLDVVERGFTFQPTTIDVDLYLSKVYMYNLQVTCL